jgi:hypothetical protein
MHKYFADWYRVMTIESNAETLSNRWEGVEAVIKSLDSHLVLDIVRLFFKKRPKDPNFLVSFAEYFKNADITFPMRGNDLELQVLAGASIVNCLETSQKYAINIAYAVVCSDLQGLIQPVLMPEVIDDAKTYLLKESTKTHSKIEFAEIKVEIESDDLPTSITQLIDTANNSLKSLYNSIQIQKEESNILWWLFGEYSNDMKCRMAELKLPAASLIAGKELADLTLFVPGHSSAEAILDKMLRSGRKDIAKATTLSAAIKAAPLTWRQQLLKQIDMSEIDELCPILYAICKSIETKDDVSWAVIFENNIGVSAEEPILAVRLAMQIFQEILFASNY